MSEFIDPTVQQQALTSPQVNYEGMFDPNSTEAIQLRYIELMLSGGTEEMGHTIGAAILKRINPEGALSEGTLSHSLIMQAEPVDRRMLQASDIPINRGILESFGVKPSEEMDSFVSNKVVRLGNTGLSAMLFPLWTPREELTDAEVKGLRKRFIEPDGQKAKDGGIIVLPKFALRAVLFGPDGNPIKVDDSGL